MFHEVSVMLRCEHLDSRYDMDTSNYNLPTQMFFHPAPLYYSRLENYEYKIALLLHYHSVVTLQGRYVSPNLRH